MNTKNNYKMGLFSSFLCGLMWGILPVYWDALKPINSFVIIFYRILLMSVTCFIACCHTYGIRNVFKPMFKSRKDLMIYLTSGIIVAINWGIYVWSVNAGFVIQTSMGYFLEPLLVCLFGMIFYKERANRWKKTGLLFALAALFVMIIGYRQIPMIAVGLGLSFAIYSAIKKSVQISPIQSLLCETVFLVPVTLVLIIYFECTGKGALSVGDSSKFILLLFAGIATAVPMGFFSYAANRLPLITLGLTGYISPSIALILGIFLFKEPFDSIQFTAFVITWIGLAIFTYGEIKEQKGTA